MQQAYTRTQEAQDLWRKFTRGAQHQASAYRTGYGMTQAQCDTLIIRAARIAGSRWLGSVTTGDVDAAFDAMEAEGEVA